MISDCHKLKKSYRKVLLLFSTTAIIASAFHFWPFASNPLWKLANVANLSIVVGVVTVVLGIIFEKNKKVNVRKILPPLSIWAFLVFQLLSCAYADTFSRPAVYIIKVSLVMIGGYVLFACAFESSKANSVSWAIIIACFISVLSAIHDQYLLKSTNCGFFENVYKYGTYTAIMSSFAIIYLFSERILWQYLLGFLLLFGMVLTLRNIGALAGVLSGLGIGLILHRRWTGGNVFCLGIVSLVIIGIGTIFNTAILQDARLIEKDGQNLRQRYIEWQAEINMLETYGITGSGAGSINDYRSNYYYRLPKLNTLEPFDQNGWLTVSAETGIIGLLCFIWIIYGHGRYIFCSRSNLPFGVQRMSTALLAALIASCVCNVFSSVYYNGVLIAFTVILALSKSVCDSTRKDPK